MSRFLIPFLIAILLSSCQPQNDDVVVCGQIHGYENSQVAMYNAESIYMNRPFEQPIDTVFTNEQGEFCFTVKTQKSILIHLLAEDDFNLIETPIVINPKDSVYIETSIFNTSRPLFGGSNSHFNHFHLNQRQNLYRTFRHKPVNEWSIEKFVSYCDSIQQRALKAIDSISNLNSINPIGINLVKADLLLFIAAKRLEYLQQHINETQGEWLYFIPSSSFYSFKNNLLESTEAFWFLPSYSMAVDAMLEDDYQHIPQVIEDQVGMHPHMLKAKLQLIESNYSGISQEVALAQIARHFPQFLNSPDPFSLFEKAEILLSNSGMNATIAKYFTMQLDKVLAIKPGNLAPNITLPNEKGETISLSDLKGKVVLIIFWGTWCPPCLAAIPEYIEIQQQFSKQDIAFVFISLEARADDVQAWKDFVLGKSKLSKKFLNDRPFPGIHLVAHGQFKNSQVQAYAVNYAPSYVLIDREGKVVNPRANLDENLIEQIDGLLSKE